MTDPASSPSEDSNSSEPVSQLEQMGAITAIAGLSHALTDFLLSDDALLQRFSEFLDPSSSGLSDGEVREIVQKAHDMLAALQERAEQRYALAVIFGPGTDASGFPYN